MHLLHSIKTSSVLSAPIMRYNLNYDNTHTDVLLIEPDVLIQGLQHFHVEPAELQEHAIENTQSYQSLITSLSIRMPLI